MNNRLPALQRRARAYLDRLVIAYDYKTEGGVDLINYKLGVFAPYNMQLFNLATNKAYRWDLIFVAVGLDSKGGKVFSTVEGQTVNRVNQADMASYVHGKMDKFKKDNHKGIEVLTNTAWIASPMKRSLTDGQIDKILTLRGAW